MRVRKPSLEGMLVIITYLALVAFNAMSEIFRLGGVTAGDVSNEVFTWFAPAGYVFSIWSVIYIGLAIWAVRFAFLRGSSQDGMTGGEFSARSRRIGPEAVLFVLSSILNIAWLVMWHLRVFPATIAVIAAMLACVAVWYLETRRRSDSPLDWEPIAIYGSWLTLATVANVAHVLTRSTPTDAGLIPAVSTVVILILLVGVAYAVRYVFDEYAFGLVLAWAGIGIGVHLLDVSAPMGVAVIVLSVLGPALALLPWERIRVVRRM